MDREKRSDPRDPGEAEQNLASKRGLTDIPVVEGADVGGTPEAPFARVVEPGKCPECGRDR